MTAHKDINKRLQEAIDGLRHDATRVEIWATALSGFAQPIPDYEPDRRYDLAALTARKLEKMTSD